MANYTDIYLELETYLAKYAERTFPQRILTVKKTNDIGIWILGMLRPSPDESYRGHRSGPPASNELLIRICDRYTREIAHGHFLPVEAKDHIRRKLRKMFVEDLRSYVRKSHLDTGVAEKDALRSFFGFYTISEDDFSEESMYRDYSRWKKSKRIEVEKLQ